MRWVFISAVIAMATHLFIVYATPTTLTARAIENFSKNAPINSIFHQERLTQEDALSDFANLDLIYDTCAFDVSRNPISITAEVPQSFWSLSLYADNRQVFFSIDEVKAGAAKIEIILIGPDADRDRASEEIRIPVIRTPSTKGVAVFRTLIPGDSRFAEVDEIRRRSTCSEITPEAEEPNDSQAQ